ncbi:MAG: hypothetical protein R3B06_15145 [Kofleriaceae bacterium]
MTGDDRFAATARAGGALACAQIDGATRQVRAGFAHDGLVSPRLLDLLLGTVRPAGPITQACGGPPVNAARELFVAGPGRSLFCAVVPRGDVVIMAAPPAMSLARGWALLAALVTSGGAA